MAKNKHKKKSSATSVSQGDSAQAETLFEQYHEVAQALHQSSDQQQAEIALESVTREAEAAQMALIALLARTADTDAADVLLALNVLSPLKNVRKEARRGLLRLEQNKTYPGWQLPITHTSPLESIEEAGNAPRFWKGYVTDSRDAGEVSMMLMWEQGEEYRDVRTVGMLLEFWHDGVKDFFTYVESKRRAQKTIDEFLPQGQFIPCSLAKAKRLLQQALDVNKKAHTSPYRDYRLNISLVNQLILEAPVSGEEEPEESAEANEDEIIDLTQITPIDAIAMFVEAWCFKNYTLAYDLLAANSPVREGLSRESWVEQREQWAEQAQPDMMRRAFISEHETPKSGLWLPNPIKRRATTTQEFEAGWSIELADSADMETLPELPKPTLVHKESGRCWFWGTYTVAREEDGWRIQNIADEGAQANTLPIAQIEKRIGELTKEAEKITERSPVGAEIDEMTLTRDIYDVLALLNTALFFQDIRLKKPGVGEDAFREAFTLASSLQSYERAIAYLDLLMERLPETRAEILPIRSATLLQLRERLEMEDSEEVDEQIERLGEQAEADAREALRIENTAQGHLLLGQLLSDSDEDERLDEAETHLREAETMGVGPLESTLIQHTLGDIASAREQYEQALGYYQRVAEIDENYDSIWHHIGDTYESLGNTTEAEASFKKAIELHPADLEVYSHLVGIYEKQDRYTEAREMLQQGLLANPDSPYLLALLAAVYYDSGEREEAEELLKEAEEIDPDEPLVQVYRAAMQRMNEEREQAQQ